MTIYPLVRALTLPLVARVIRDVTGTEHLPGGGYIVAPNHVDWLDGFYLSAAIDRATGRRVKYLTASNNYWWSGVTIQIPPAVGEVINQAVLELKADSVVCNFPEGQRNNQPSLMTGRTGTVRMAVLADVPVVPVGIIADAGRTMGESIRFGLSGAHPVTIHFGPPLRFQPPANGVSHGWLTAETRRLMAAIAPLAQKSI